MESSNKSKPSNKEIVKYWENKYITYDLEVTDNPEYSAFKMIESMDSPHCFCCTVPVIMTNLNLVKNSTFSNCQVINNWDSKIVKGNFEVAHILPKALGGTYDCANLLLLCKQCHYESPDTSDYKQMFAYMLMIRLNPIAKYIERWEVDVLNMHKQACSLGKDIRTISDDLTNLELTNFISLHGNVTSPMSKAAAIANSLIKDINFNEITIEELDKIIEVYEENGVTLAREILINKYNNSNR